MVSTHPFKQLFNFAASEQRQIVLASFYSVLNKIFDLAPPVLIGIAVDTVVKKQDSFLSQWVGERVFDQIIILAVLTVIIWGLESIFEYAFAVSWRNIAQRLQHRIRVEAFSHIQSLDMSYFENERTGRLMSILNDDINQLERFLDGGANSILQVLTTVMVIGGIFFYMAPEVAFFGFVPIPIILWGSFAFQKKLLPKYSLVREKVANLNSHLANIIMGIATVKSYTAESKELARVSKLSEDYSLANTQAIRLSSAFSPLIRMAIVVGFIAILIMGGRKTLDGAMEVGTYSVMIYMVQRLLWPLTRLGETFDLYQRALASTKRIFELFAKRSAIVDLSQVNLVAANQSVLFKDINFQYPSGFQVLNNLSLTCEKSKTTAIVGLTGSGKSTLIKLLLRFYEPSQGEILIGSQRLEQVSLKSLRSQIGLVSQDVFLFDGTVAENIAYGQNASSKKAIIEAAKQAEAHEFIMSLPEAYDTHVGERGQKLSGGQKQRLSIARAVLKDPSILILDEATSSVDNETEAAIQRSLVKLCKDRTTIVVAHRLSTIKKAYKIHVLQNGELQASGKHEELLASPGLYQDLWAVQTGEHKA